jgi:hypothetical protein
MTATFYNARFVKDGIQVTVMTRDYKENFNKANLKQIPSVLTSQNRVSPSDPTYGVQNKSQVIDLGINPERRLTINGFLINDSAYGDTHTYAMDKKNDLTRMFMEGGNVTLTLETGGVYTFFTNVICDKWEFGKVVNDSVTPNGTTPYQGVSQLKDGVVEYDCTISVLDANEYGT